MDSTTKRMCPPRHPDQVLPRRTKIETSIAVAAVKTNDLIIARIELQKPIRLVESHPHRIPIPTRTNPLRRETNLV